MVSYKTRSENDEFAHYYNLWPKDTVWKYYTYVTSAGIGINDYNRSGEDFPVYTNPKIGIVKREEAGNSFVVDSNHVYNPVQGCVHIRHRETARLIKHIRWPGDITRPVFNRYGYGEPTIELNVQLYGNVWNPDFGYNNIVNRFHIWSPENSLAIGSSGYVTRDRIDNDHDGDGSVYDIDSVRNAENGSDAMDGDIIPEENVILFTEQNKGSIPGLSVIGDFLIPLRETIYYGFEIITVTYQLHPI